MQLATFRPVYTLLCAALLVPLWVGPYPPLVDLPQQAGQVSAALAWFRGDPTFRELFELNLLTPYLGGYLLAGPLVALFGPSVGLRLTLSLALIAVPVATSHLLRTAGLPRWWVLPVFAAAPGYAFHWGFLGFVVTAPLGLWALSYHLRWTRHGNRRDGWLCTVLVVACFLGHALVFLWVALSGGLASLLARGTIGARARRLWPLLVPAPLALLWLVHTVDGPGRAEAAIYWELGLERLLRVPLHLAGALAHDEALLLLGLCVLVSPLLLGARPSAPAPGWAVLGATCALCLFGPERVMSATYLPWRYTVFLVPALLLCLRPRVNAAGALAPVGVVGAVGAGVAVTLCVVTSWLNLRSFARFGEQITGFAEVTQRIPRGARVAYLAFGRSTRDLRGPALLHFGQWAQAERGAIVDFSFAEFFPEVMRYRPNSSSGWPPGAEWTPHLFDYAARRGDHYDFFLVCNDRPVEDELYRGAPVRGRLLAQAGYFWLYSAGGASPNTEPPAPHEGRAARLSPAAVQKKPEQPATGAALVSR
jgi:hypothetical protein